MIPEIICFFFLCLSNYYTRGLCDRRVYFVINTMISSSLPSLAPSTWAYSSELFCSLVILVCIATYRAYLFALSVLNIYAIRSPRSVVVGLLVLFFGCCFYRINYPQFRQPKSTSSYLLAKGTAVNSWTVSFM